MLAFIFPGQGSQSVGMLAELGAAHAVVTDTFSEASDVLGYDLWDLCQNGPAEKLNTTEFTQPALLAAGVAVWRVWQQQQGASPVYLAGHSLGEYTALVCAGSLSFGDGVDLVAHRGRYMQAAVPEGEGAMAAIIGLADEKVVEVCQATSEKHGVVVAANFNAPGQVVISGASTAVEQAMAAAKAAGAKLAKRLPVSVPSHSPLMQDAAKHMAAKLAAVTIAPCQMPVLHNVDVTAHEEPEAIRECLVKQLYSPVRWVETIQALSAAGVTRMIECGPGKVLAGLNKRIDRALATHTIDTAESLQSTVTEGA